MHQKSRSFKHVLGVAAVLALPVAALAAPAASRSDAYPPPGLYRVDSEGTMQRSRGELPAIMQQMMQDGATGNARMSAGRAGGPAVTRKDAGQGAVNFCMPALAAGAVLPAAKGCKASAAVTGPAGVSYAAQCGGLKMNTTIRKIDAKTWEYKVVSTESGAAVTGQPDYAGARSVLAAQAKNGATAAERAEAAELLAQMGTYEAEMKSKAAELAGARAEMAGGVPMAGAGNLLKERTSILRLTRIADTCTTAAR